MFCGLDLHSTLDSGRIFKFYFTIAIHFKNLIYCISAILPDLMGYQGSSKDAKKLPRLGSGAGTFLMEHMPKSTQRVGGCIS